ncbi:hypothetical protein HN807_05220 [Candidatus Bathyarchaeota archaeon]|nr:hypothetical protein [Candidatus Bathyarchaeota archaeon]MBT6603802.1 hypothetical protein [Candidatus Bathyarchaeota archaeon]MBT7185849.1 hypothetical protein [Candidatus Bathyarchaeota archaeon]MBT7346466.1 hypothetical protein [Candidatus Bathyarchaeota archaeon]
MPFTPYHVGPALLVALLLYPLLDIPAFLVASLALDFEPLLWLLNLLPWSMHGRFHSLTISIIIGLAVAGLFILFRKYAKPIRLPAAFAQDPSVKMTLISSVAGVWGHVLLDAIVHDDINLLWPVQWNPLFKALDYSTVIIFCIISFPIAIILYMIRSTVNAWKLSKDIEPIEKVEPRISEEEPFLFDPGQPIANDLFIDAAPVIIKPEPVEVIPEPEPIPFELFTTPEPEKDAPEEQFEYPENKPEQESFEPEEEMVPGGIRPEIFLGVDGTPVQWGLIGKSGIDRVAVDLNEPHIVFLCGKQGSGKGYSIGVITEMLLSKTIPGISQVKKPATVIVFHKPREDLRSEFWSIVEPNLNSAETKILREEYKISARRVINSNNIRVFVDPFVYENERPKFRGDYGADVYPIAIKPQRLTAEDWPYVLSIGRKSGSMYVKKIFQIIKKTQYDEDFGIDKIKRHIDMSDLNPNQKSFANMRLETLQDYLDGGDFMQNLNIGGVNLFDLRKIMMEPDDIFSVMMLVISSLINDDRTEREQFVFVINEAHDYLRKGLSKEFTDYINYLIRKKRHAGTWLMLDTHFPEDVDPKVIKGSDIKIFHKSDVISSTLLKQVVNGTPLPPHLLETGQAIIRADKSNQGPDSLLVVQIRPRLTHHGGATKTAV